MHMSQQHKLVLSVTALLLACYAKKKIAGFVTATDCLGNL